MCVGRYKVMARLEQCEVVLDILSLPFEGKVQAISKNFCDTLYLGGMPCNPHIPHLYVIVILHIKHVM